MSKYEIHRGSANAAPCTLTMLHCSAQFHNKRLQKQGFPYFFQSTG